MVWRNRSSEFGISMTDVGHEQEAAETFLPYLACE